MSEINILHISDLHISEHEMHEPIFPLRRESAGIFVKSIFKLKGYFVATYSRYNLRALTTFIRNNRNNLNGVIITGDISTTGLDFDLERTYQFVNGVEGLSPVLSRIEPNLQGINGKDELLLLPGNHDRYKIFKYLSALGKLLGYFPGNRLFDSVFHKYWDDDVMEMVIPKEDFTVGVFAADFNLKNFLHSRPVRPSNWHAQGKVYTDICDKLVSATNNFKEKYVDADKLIIWAVHFPPEAPDIKKHSELLEKTELISAAHKNGVSLILSGHLHDPSRRQVAPNTYVLTAGTATQHYAPEGNFCHLISITNNNDNYQIKRVCYKLSGKDTSLEKSPRAEFIEYFTDEEIIISK